MYISSLLNFLPLQLTTEHLVGFPVLQQHVFISYPLCAAAAAKSLQSCTTLCDPIDGSRPGSAIPAILQARGEKWLVCGKFKFCILKVSGNEKKRHIFLI